MSDRASGYLINKFTRRLELHDRNTQCNKDLNLLRCRLKTAQRSFTSWNRLPKDLKEAVNPGTFMKRILNNLFT